MPIESIAKTQAQIDGTPVTKEGAVDYAYNQIFNEKEEIVLYDNKYIGSVNYRPRLPLGKMKGLLEDLQAGDMNWGNFTSFAAESMGKLSTFLPDSFLKGFENILGVSLPGLGGMVAGAIDFFGGLFSTGISFEEMKFDYEQKRDKFITEGITKLAQGIATINENLMNVADSLSQQISEGISYLEESVIQNADRIIENVKSILHEKEIDRDAIFQLEKIYFEKVKDLRDDHLKWTQDLYSIAWDQSNRYKKKLLIDVGSEIIEFSKFVDLTLQQEEERVKKEALSTNDVPVLQEFSTAMQAGLNPSAPFPWWIIILIVLLSGGGYFYIAKKDQKKK